MRILHKLYAHIFAYFWLPCPRCGEMFGGHELPKSYEAIYSPDGSSGKMVCKACAAPQRKINERLWKEGKLKYLTFHRDYVPEEK